MYVSSNRSTVWNLPAGSLWRRGLFFDLIGLELVCAAQNDFSVGLRHDAHQRSPSPWVRN
jgi:hypothetical protein